MTKMNHIIDVALAPAQDYNFLRDKGIKHIEKMSGRSWSNLNSSDPGITILDQICYALTELSYCTAFPIKDIITQRDGKIKAKNQFFHPDKILTTSPITLEDYTKYLVNAIDEIKNTSFIASQAGAYVSYLLCTQQSKSYSDSITQSAYIKLNESRNLGEQFVKPIVCKDQTYYLKGNIEIAHGSSSKVLDDIQIAIRNKVFPFLEQRSYNGMREIGLSTNAIFNGPRLENGWISDNSEKKNKLSTNDIREAILSVNEVESIDGIQIFQDEEEVNIIHIEIDQIPVFDLQKGYDDNVFSVHSKGKERILEDLPINNSDLEQIRALESISAAVKVDPSIESGEYRDIESYYSIQNTFPAVYKIGAHSIEQEGSDFDQAISRQLKGYLTLFDQVLANQFSQLSHIDQLFSFKNDSIANHKDHRKYSALKKNKKNIEYPIPYKTFAPTYFYQSIYEVPNIKALLSGNEMFDFEISDLTEKEIESKSWKRYKQDPYNSYMDGLKRITEDKEESLKRRIEILNHLMARHGMSPNLIQNFTRHSRWTGYILKDEIIAKSLLLQNFEELSYNQSKAYDYLQADVLVNTENLRKERAVDLFKDGLIDNKKIDLLNKLSKDDFRNFSTLELQLDLLFGFRQQYKMLLDDKSNSWSKVQRQQALWFIQKRRGFFLLENQLLVRAAKFSPIFRKGDNYWTYRSNKDLQFEDILSFDSQANITENSEDPNHISVSGIDFEKVKSCDRDSSTFVRINKDFSLSTQLKWGSEILFLNDPLINGKIEIIFPGFFPEISKAHYKQDLKDAICTYIQPHLLYDLHYPVEDDLTQLIQQYINWHNSLLDDGQPDVSAAEFLINWIQK